MSNCFPQLSGSHQFNCREDINPILGKQANCKDMQWQRHRRCWNLLHQKILRTVWALIRQGHLSLSVGQGSNSSFNFFCRWSLCHFVHSNTPSKFPEKTALSVTIRKEGKKKKRLWHSEVKMSTLLTRMPWIDAMKSWTVLDALYLYYSSVSKMLICNFKYWLLSHTRGEVKGLHTQGCICASLLRVLQSALIFFDKTPTSANFKMSF